MASTWQCRLQQQQCKVASKGTSMMCTCWAMTSFSIMGLLALLLCLAAPVSASADSAKKCLLLSYMLWSRWRIFTMVSKICFSTALGMWPSSCTTPAQGSTIRQTRTACLFVLVQALQPAAACAGRLIGCHACLRIRQQQPLCILTACHTRMGASQTFVQDNRCDAT